MLAALFARVVPVRPGETLPMLLATAYGFSILFAYYLLRPVRDEIGAADRGNLQLLWTAVFIVMLLAVPLYSAAVARLRRGVFIPLANRFFAANLILFYLALVLLPESARLWIDRVFYVWVSVFALFVVTVFWGLLVDLFDDDQGKRLFGFITVGSSLGGILGSASTALLAPHVPVFLLLLLAVLPLEVASQLARALDNRAEQTPATLKREPEARIGGNAWSGIGPVFRSSALRNIALWILLMTFASTILYFVQAHLVGEAITDRALRRAFLARVDLAVNSCHHHHTGAAHGAHPALHRRRGDARRAAGSGGTRLHHARQRVDCHRPECAAHRARALRQQPPRPRQASPRGAIHAPQSRAALQIQGLHRRRRVPWRRPAQRLDLRRPRRTRHDRRRHRVGRGAGCRALGAAGLAVGAERESDPRNRMNAGTSLHL
jgi:hypothetical protein